MLWGYILTSYTAEMEIIAIDGQRFRVVVAVFSGDYMSSRDVLIICWKCARLRVMWLVIYSISPITSGWIYVSIQLICIHFL